MRVLILAAGAAMLLAACAPQPMTQARAERLCRDEARLADGVAGTVGVGIGSNGPVANADITITNRIFNPQSEADALEACVIRRMQGRPAPSTGPTVGITLSRRS